MANKKGMNPLAAGAIGAAVGAAIGVATVELSDARNRKIVGKKLGELREEGEKVYTQIKETATEARDKVEAARNDAEKKTQKSATRKLKS